MYLPRGTTISVRKHDHTAMGNTGAHVLASYRQHSAGLQGSRFGWKVCTFCLGAGFEVQTFHPDHERGYNRHSNKAPLAIARVRTRTRPGPHEAPACCYRRKPPPSETVICDLKIV
jgi:hypothetical protein